MMPNVCLWVVVLVRCFMRHQLPCRCRCNCSRLPCKAASYACGALRAASLIQVCCRYNSYRYGGEKRLVISTATWLGGHNTFMGIAYLVAGASSLLFALAFLLLQSAFPRPLGDLSRLSWTDGSASVRSSGIGPALIT